MFEHRSRKLASYGTFALRLVRHLMVVVALTIISLLAGMAGYRYFEGLPWTDCFLNTAMILGGMGEIDPLRTEGGKIFAGVYALYSGLFVIACMGVLLAPGLHRMMHRFHAE